MIATTEREMLREVREATGLPEIVVCEIVAIHLGQSDGDCIAVAEAADEDLSTITDLNNP